MAERLEAEGAYFALGGSGLLAALGVGEHAGDWDVTTDDPLAVVGAAFDGIEQEAVAPDGPFATRYLLKLRMPGALVEILGSFAIRHDDGVFHVPTIVTGRWRDIPVGSAEAWAVAYALLGREEKAELLFERLAERGADPFITADLCGQALPVAVRDRLLATLPSRSSFRPSSSLLSRSP